MIGVNLFLTSLPFVIVQKSLIPAGSLQNFNPEHIHNLASSLNTIANPATSSCSGLRGDGFLWVFCKSSDYFVESTNSLIFWKLLSIHYINDFACPNSMKSANLLLTPFNCDVSYCIFNQIFLITLLSLFESLRFKFTTYPYSCNHPSMQEPFNCSWTANSRQEVEREFISLLKCWLRIKFNVLAL